jgi:hypothetical protein
MPRYSEAAKCKTAPDHFRGRRLSQTKLVSLRTRSWRNLFALFLSALWFPLPGLSPTRWSSARLCVGTLSFLFSYPCFTWGCAGGRRCAALAKFRRRSCPLPLWTPHLPASFRRVGRAARRLFGTWGAQAALRSSFLFARRLCCLGSCAGLPGWRRSRLQSPPALFAGRLCCLGSTGLFRRHDTLRRAIRGWTPFTLFPSLRTHWRRDRRSCVRW